MSAKKYFGAFCLYLNYLVHGIGVLVMSLNVHEFEVQWQTDAAGVSVVISSLGLGRLALLVLAGSLSDKYGRRPFVLLGTVTYLAFFIGLLFTHDVGFLRTLGRRRQQSARCRHLSSSDGTLPEGTGTGSHSGQSVCRSGAVFAPAHSEFFGRS